MLLYYIFKVATGGEMRNFVLSNTRFNLKLSIFVAEYLLYTQDMGK